MPLKQAESGPSAQTFPPTTESSPHDHVTSSPPTGTSDESPTGDYGPADIFEQEGHACLRYESKVVPNKIFVFDFTRKMKEVRRFRCRDCVKVATLNGTRLAPPGMVRPVHVRDGKMVTDPEKPRGGKHVCLRDMLDHTSSPDKERSATCASNDTPQTSKSSLLEDGITSGKAKIEERPSDGSLKASAAVVLVAGITMRNGRTLPRPTPSFRLRPKKAPVSSKNAKATSDAEGGAPEADAVATGVEASEQPVTAKKRPVTGEKTADDDLPQVDNNQQDPGTDAAALESVSAKKRRVYQSEPHDNPPQGDFTQEDPCSDTVVTQVEAADDPSSAKKLCMDQEPSDNESLQQMENNQKDGGTDSPDLDLHLSAASSPVRTAAENHEDVVQEDDVFSVLDDTLGTLEGPGTDAAALESVSTKNRRVDQEPSDDESLDLNLSAASSPVRTAAENHEDVVQEKDVVSVLDDTLGTLEVPKQEALEDVGNDRSSSADGYQRADPATEDTPPGSLNLRELLKRLVEALRKEVRPSASHADTTDTRSPTAGTPSSDESQPGVSVAGPTAAVNDPLQADFAPNFGPAIFVNDRSVVHFENIFGGTYAFSLVEERRVPKNGATHLVRTYRCQGCVDASRQLKRDVPLVKTVGDQFVERDPDCPLGNVHICAHMN